LLYGAENWKVGKKNNAEIANRHKQVIKGEILKIHWPDKISNIELWNKTKQEPVQTVVK
jgi:hypothetical protein